MLKDNKNRKKIGPYIMTDEVQKAFKRLKNAFSSILVLFTIKMLRFVLSNTLLLGSFSGRRSQESHFQF